MKSLPFREKSLVRLIIAVLKLDHLNPKMPLEASLFHRDRLLQRVDLGPKLATILSEMTPLPFPLKRLTKSLVIHLIEIAQFVPTLASEDQDDLAEDLLQDQLLVHRNLLPKRLKILFLLINLLEQPDNLQLELILGILVI